MYLQLLKNIGSYVVNRNFAFTMLVLPIIFVFIYQWVYLFYTFQPEWKHLEGSRKFSFFWSETFMVCFCLFFQVLISWIRLHSWNMGCSGYWNETDFDIDVYQFPDEHHCISGFPDWNILACFYFRWHVAVQMISFTLIVFQKKFWDE